MSEQSEIFSEPPNTGGGMEEAYRYRTVSVRGIGFALTKKRDLMADNPDDFIPLAD